MVLENGPILTGDEFEQLGVRTAKYKSSRSEIIRLRRFKSNFGVAPEVVADAWDLLMENRFLRNRLPGRLPPDPVHFLWALMLLKGYSTVDKLASHLQINEDTLQKWTHFYLEAMAELDSEVVSMLSILMLPAPLWIL